MCLICKNVPVLLILLGFFCIGISGLVMAYIPPHKRNSNEAERPVLTPDKLAPLFMRNVNVRSSKSNNKWGSKLIYADRAISKWWAVGLNDDTRFPSSVNLKPISSETIEHRIGEKPLALRNSDLDDGQYCEIWLYVKNFVYSAL